MIAPSVAKSAPVIASDIVVSRLNTIWKVSQSLFDRLTSHALIGTVVHRCVS